MPRPPHRASPTTLQMGVWGSWGGGHSSMGWGAQHSGAVGVWAQLSGAGGNGAAGMGGTVELGGAQQGWGGTAGQVGAHWSWGGGTLGLGGGRAHPGAQYVSVVGEQRCADDAPSVLRALEVGVGEQEEHLTELGGRSGGGTVRQRCNAAPPTHKGTHGRPTAAPRHPMGCPGPSAAAPQWAPRDSKDP